MCTGCLLSETPTVKQLCYVYVQVIYISTTDCVLSALTHYCTVLLSNPMLQFFSIAYTHRASLDLSKLYTQIPKPLTQNATTFTTLCRSISDSTLSILS